MSVSDNIRNLEGNMKKYMDQTAAIQIEMYRTEGSLRVFKNFADLGIETIKIPPRPEDIVDDSEVIDKT